MALELNVDGRGFELTPENASVQLVMPNHVLDHILIVEFVATGTEQVPHWKRAFRELFEKNGISFEDVALDMIGSGFVYVEHPDIPQAFEDCYATSVMQSVDAEWANYYSKG